MVPPVAGFVLVSFLGAGVDDEPDDEDGDDDESDDDDDAGVDEDAAARESVR